MAEWKREHYRGYDLEAFPAMLGWEIQGVLNGKHAFTFMTPASDAEACLRHGRAHVDVRLAPPDRNPYSRGLARKARNRRNIGY